MGISLPCYSVPDVKCTPYDSLGVSPSVVSRRLIYPAPDRLDSSSVHYLSLSTGPVRDDLDVNRYERPVQPPRGLVVLFNALPSPFQICSRTRKVLKRTFGKDKNENSCGRALDPIHATILYT
jgi:hypothetical protein